MLTRRQKTLLRGGHAARYVPTGHLLYVTGRRLQAVGFDEETLDTRGVPTTVEGVEIAGTFGGFMPTSTFRATARSPMCPRRRPSCARWRGWTARAVTSRSPQHRWSTSTPECRPMAHEWRAIVAGGNRDIWMWPSHASAW